EDARAARRAQAVQWGRLAAAVQGDFPNDQRNDARGELQNADNLRGKLADMAELPEEKWQAAADSAGDHIGRHWQRLAAAGQDSDVRAELRSRWAVAFRPLDGPESAAVNRQKRWQSLLVALALRTARDHWYEAERRPRE